MPYDPEKHHRHSIRLPGYDYAQPGAYYVTICTKDRLCLFGEVVDGEMRLNNIGRVVKEGWFRSADIRQEVQLFPDEFVAMPNHIHGIVWIVEHGNVGMVGAHGRAPLHHAPQHRAPRSLGSFVAGFKSATTRQINEIGQTPRAPVWQRNYYEHIIRTEDALHRIREYITTNPLRWHLDRENPDRTGRNPDEEMWFSTI
ncbi:MAG: transposase [Chlorobi bacterium NICIL-2]|jgi:putative transposase|nr:MAG: transposase [Chlorobi bacterium NICIL-2]